MRFFFIPIFILQIQTPVSEVTKSTGKKWQTVIKILAAYLVAAWTFLQFVDWVLIRYNISPYWVDILLWMFVGVIPSLIIYLYHKERINNGILKLREKIIIPLNILLIGVIIFFVFGNSDLGSTTKEVTFTNNSGEVETQTITKEEFRIGIPIFNFQQKNKDTLHSWLGNTINKVLKIDLQQNKTLMPSWYYVNNTIEKINTSRVFDKYYVDGEYEVSNGIYTIIPVLRNSKNGNEITRKTFSGSDFFSLIDEISIFIKNNVGIVKETQNTYIDLEIRDITTSSMEALKYWSNNSYEQATKVDDKFALAYLDNAIRRNKYSHGELEEKYQIDKAYENKAKLPTQIQFEILMYKNIIYNRWQDAKELVKYQLEIEPNNATYNYLLDLIYSETKNIEGYYKHASERFNKVKNETNARSYFQALILKREFKKAIDLIKVYEVMAPNTEEVQLIKAYAYLMSGDIKKAKETYKKVNLLWPKESIHKEEVKKYIAYKEKNDALNFNIEALDGFYRSTGSEQQIEYFKKANNYMVHYKNQLMYVTLPYNNMLLSLNGGWLGGSKHIFEKDSTNNIYRVQVQQFNQNNLNTFYYYKENKDISKAYKMLKEKKYDSLSSTFKNLVEKYPKHWFIKQAAQHIEYVKSTDKKALENQYKAIVGSYANRKFWIEDNRLYYKRDNLTKVEILPISKTRYISLTKFDTNYEFEFLPNNKIASFALVYNIEKEAWDSLKNNTNYLLKN